MKAMFNLQRKRMNKLKIIWASWRLKRLTKKVEALIISLKNERGTEFDPSHMDG